MLKPKGKLLLVDWSEASQMSPQTVVPSAKAQTLFEKNGFKLETSFPAGDHHYGMIFSRN